MIGVSLVVQWLLCRGHEFDPCSRKSNNYWSSCHTAHAPRPKPLAVRSPHSPQLEKVHAQQWKPNTPKYTFFNKINKNISYRIYCITRGIQPIFYSNYDWSITFKNCESLYFTPVTYIALGTNYTSIQKRQRQKKKKPTDTGNTVTEGERGGRIY